LLSVFLGSIFGGADTANLLGQAGRQIMFITVSVYGWVQWRKSQQAGSADDSAIVPEWASWPVRIGLVVTLVGATILLTPVFRALGCFEPVWADAWTFVGSLLATFGMAKGWVEFWLIWVIVDVVGVPVLFLAGYYSTAFGSFIFRCLISLGLWFCARHRATGQ